MRLGQKILIISVFLYFGLAFGLAVFAQNDNRGVSGTSAMPLELLRPQYGEDPRFPQDYVIGELGRGGATVETYKLAREIVASLVAGDGRVDQVAFPEHKRLAALNRLSGLGVRSWRVGGGRSEGDGGYSFLVRFLGRERSITGELYLQWETPVVIDEVEAEAVESSMSPPAETDTVAETEGVAPETGNAATEPGNTATETRRTEPENGAAAEPRTATAESVAAEMDNATAELRTTAEETESAETDPEAAVAETEDEDAKPVVEPGVETVIKEEPKLEDKPHWRVDDLLLEPPRGLAEGRYGPGGADMTPYERFF